MTGQTNSAVSERQRCIQQFVFPFQAISPCDKKLEPCSGHGECIDLNSSHYFCQCHANHYGSKCEESIDRCSSNPCLHGHCIAEIDGYRCICLSGYDGNQCQRGEQRRFFFFFRKIRLSELTSIDGMQQYSFLIIL